MAEPRSSSANARPCIGTAVVHLPLREIAPYVDADAALETVDAQTTRVTMGSWSWGALAACFAGFDARFEVVAPAALLQSIADLARRLEQARPGRTGRS